MNFSRLSASFLITAMALVSAAPAAARHHPMRAGAAPEAFVQAQATSWVGAVTNPYFPLAPGTIFHYEGESDGIPTSDDMIVTHDTKVIVGVTCTVVHDIGYTNGIVSEDTFDWYAQDGDGNVWYFGEDTKELDVDGNVISTEGSWEAGVNGAQQGIIMEANPRVGDKYQQEFAAGVAEDMAQVLNLNRTGCVPYGCFDDLLLTKEFTPLEKGLTEHKSYAPGVGDILEEVVKGGDERNELVSVSTGP
jgi:hypothetical protein